MIREFQQHDVEDILAVWESASAVAHPFLSEEFLEQERYNIPNVYLPHAETWVWESGSPGQAGQGESARVVGFLALIGNEVGAIFVDPQSQRQGIGRALMNHAQQLRGELEVEVFTANEIGRSFYHGYGFEPLEKKIHEATGFELIRMRFAA